MVIDLKNITDAIDEAIKQFGVYNYTDKGAEETVADFDVICYAIESLPAQEAVTLLKALAQHEYGEQAVNDIITSLDDQPDEWFDTVVDTLREAGLDVY
jgi:hypothetical protein